MPRETLQYHYDIMCSEQYLDKDLSLQLQKCTVNVKLFYG